MEERYELEELVGRGGMSSVYRARDRILGREVAIKMLHDQFATDTDQIERFRREARAVAKLAHSNVAVVIDRGEDEGRPYIVFEYVEGGSLKRLIQEDAPLPLDRVLEVGVQIARGLEHAHRSGLVHRDVKPQNVLLDSGGVATVIDFGIARSSAEVRPGLTLTGTVLGSSDYISPEQAQGRTVEERTDVYSLAVVLYELLTGELPFTGENFVAVAMRHINEEPPRVLDRRTDVPPRLAQLLDRCLAKEPERRPMMSAVVQELEQCLLELPVEEETVVLPVVRPRDAPGVLSNWQLITVLAGLAVGAALCIYVLVHG
ncbi:MAG: protein kinase domain-containing protein, partial [Gaiellaceae bacterium]